MPKQENMESQDLHSESGHDCVGAVNSSLAHDIRQGEAVGAQAQSMTGIRENTGGKVHQFYIVKQHPFENLNLVATDKIVRHWSAVDQKRKEKQKDRDRLCFLLRRMRKHAQRWRREDSKLLKLSKDKLCFVNKASLTTIKPGSSVDEIDNLSLHFGMLHGGNNLADERRILRKMNEAKRKVDIYMSKQELDQKIRRLHHAKNWWRLGSDKMRKIREEIQELEMAREAVMTKLEMAREEVITSAACKGKTWDSSGSKQTLKMLVQLVEEERDETRQRPLSFDAELDFMEKELALVEDELSSVEKELMRIERIKGDAYKFIFEWRKEQREANACYNQHVSLMEAARELAEKKDIEALDQLSNREVEKFMHQWKDNGHWRRDYKGRILASLNERGLTRDGRIRNHGEKPLVIEGSTANLPKRLGKAVQARRKEDLRAENQCRSRIQFQNGHHFPPLETMF